MKRKLQVFISSTYTDLIDERQAAVGAILKSGHIPAGMELFTAGDRSQMETINDWIDQSDVYMLILGGRYGSIESSTNLSYTELEFDYAVAQNKPMFSVVIKEEALERKVRDCGTNYLEKDNPKELKAFREKALGRISSFFDDLKDIKLCVYESLSDYAGRGELTGWVSASEIVDTKPLFEEIKKLSDENNELKEIIKNLESRPISAPVKPAGDIEKLSEIAEVLSHLTVTIPSTVTTTEKEEENSLLDIFYNTRSKLIQGVTNAASGATDVSRFLYFNICPKLQIHGLTENEKVTGVKYRRYFVTKLGLQLLAHIEKEQVALKKQQK
ncbi:MULTISPECIES: DUF4062 domain-containing protein [Pseudomonas]|uniref:DUF4062 domain-containing protein n=1 Tax=Pseudomonas TaxID=286 RepID=UPI001BEB112B|nr:MULTISPECIES: DUF4062 domain-containing protein [Pseudomonas]MBT2339069.1 DUF4062 domain-containing protein [Pseudomonas fluorescens]MCD4528166.1 DUF4062 domain-containing protein [Pseudomonas sp. C3-2018]